jgi:predicted AAA+ superfamily ATPase
LVRNLTFGFLPHILNSKSPWADLEDYVGLYLKEEIQQEATVRSLEGFSRFLNTVALTNAQQLNFTELGNDAQVAPRTVREYYQVLEDTLVGHILPAFENTVKRKAMTTAKFYLFDPGVTNFLLGRKTLSAKTPEFGTLLEQSIFCEIKAFLDYHAIYDSLFYWRSTSLIEVDFVVKDTKGEWLGIEVKAAEEPQRKDFSGLLALEEDLPLKNKIVVCQTKTPRINKDNIEILPVRKFHEDLWARKWI